ncbi:MAG: riboflavin biosynthesis protein RibF [Opitutales bacterium]|nr:riboflavin biosynthesis protein RibF [Opitutales bacterium]
MEALDRIPGFIELPEADIFPRPELRDFGNAAPAPLHLAVGIFDGVHLGHLRVIGAAVDAARRDGGRCGVLTFHPHPSRIFRPDDPTLLLMPAAMKNRRLFNAGVDYVVWKTFGPDFAALSADAFLPELRSALPTLTGVYVGENFRFGRGRKGDVAALAASGAKLGVQVRGEPRLTRGETPISSSRIRECLLRGAVAEANELLGRPYATLSTVTRGKRLGRQLGFPTLNLPWAPELLPRFGVYAARVRRPADPPADGLPAVANFGIRPTVEEGVEPRLECHVLTGNCPFSTGDHLLAEWLAFLRPEQRFASVDALRDRIGEDVTEARAFFARS